MSFLDRGSTGTLLLRFQSSPRPAWADSSAPGVPLGWAAQQAEPWAHLMAGREMKCQG